jgi:hypothetical protein
MAKIKARSQTGNLTPDLKKSGINPTSVHADGMWYIVEKFSTKATTLL